MHLVTRAGHLTIICLQAATCLVAVCPVQVTAILNSTGFAAYSIASSQQLPSISAASGSGLTRMHALPCPQREHHWWQFSS